MTRVDEDSNCSIAISGNGENTGKEINSTFGNIILLLENNSRRIKETRLIYFFEEFFSEDTLAYTTFDPFVPDLICISIESEDILYINTSTGEIDTIDEFKDASFYKTLTESKDIKSLIIFLKSILLLYRKLNTIEVLNKQLAIGYGDDYQNPSNIIYYSKQNLRYWLKYDNDWLRLLNINQIPEKDIIKYLKESKTLVELEEKIITLLD